MSKTAKVRITGYERGFVFHRERGSEVVSVTSKSGNTKAQYAYRLLATSKTSTMQKELQEAADEGFEYRGQNSIQICLRR